MSRSIVVLTPGRTGSSAIAGALHFLGVPMGDREENLDNIERDFAPVGLFEDTVFWEINRQTWGKEIDETTSLASYAYLIWKRYDMPIWGLKDPQAVHCFECFAPLLPDLHIIISTREKEECIQSFLKAFGGGEYLDELCPDDCTEEQYVRGLIQERLEIIDNIKKLDRYPFISIDYGDLIKNPVGWIGLLSQFAFGGLKYFPHPDNILAAVKHIDPDLRTIK